MRIELHRLSTKLLHSRRASYSGFTVFRGTKANSSCVPEVPLHFSGILSYYDSLRRLRRPFQLPLNPSQ
jgi:hypothetical protein